MKTQKLSKLITFKKLNFKVYPLFWPVLSLTLSWLIVALGQPARSSSSALLTSILGYGLFWWGLDVFKAPKRRFWVSVLWWMATEAIHLSWMCSTEFQGKYIYWIYLFVLTMMGLQFALLTSFIRAKERLTVSKMLFLASFWVILEWSRLFFICGFPFNPVGLSFTANVLALQNASIAGIYGLSFLVIFTNLIFYQLLLDFKNKKKMMWFILVVTLPYLFGGLHFSYHQKRQALSAHKPLKALLVQTALNPREKIGFDGFEHMIPPIEQWALVYQHIAEQNLKEVDLVALPERALPLSNDTLFYRIQEARALVNFYFDQKGLAAMPQLEDGQEFVDNMYFAQTLSNLFNAPVVVGLEHVERQGQKELFANASAYCFYPDLAPQIYHKQILLPLVEYLPYEWCKKLAKRYGIEGWYQRGQESMVFGGEHKIAPSICMEEMYPYIVRKGRLKGANYYLNITNDAWYPNSTLPLQHYYHGVVRGVENGVPVLRACNTGVTGAVDALGQVVGLFGGLSKGHQWTKGALFVEVPAYHYSTLFAALGDTLILGLSLIFILNYFLTFLVTVKRRQTNPLKGEAQIQ